jgi:hypothetical protein
VRRGALTWFSTAAVQKPFRADRFLVSTAAVGSVDCFPLCVEVDGELIRLPFFPFAVGKEVRVCVEWSGPGDLASAGLYGRWTV